MFESEMQHLRAEKKPSIEFQVMNIINDSCSHVEEKAKLIIWLKETILSELTSDVERAEEEFKSAQERKALFVELVSSKQ